MQKDMHFYGTYAVARIAGFSVKEARTVATAAEYVDEAVKEWGPAQLGNLRYLLPVVSGHHWYDPDNADKMDQWKVWVPFHFLPGGADGHIDERLICLQGEPGNVATDAIIDLALAAGANGRHYALHLLGIITHVIQDTYAHYGFSGITSDFNKVDQDTLIYYDVKEMGEYLDRKKASFREKTKGRLADNLMLGHGGAVTFPDRPFLNWSFEYEKNPLPEISYLHARRNNPKTFYQACTRLHAIYRAFLHGLPSMEGVGGHRPFAEDAELGLKAVIEKEGEMGQRIDYWKKAIGDSDRLFPAMAGDDEIDYSENGWTPEAMAGNGFDATTDAAKFHGAASTYLHEVLGKILPSMGILS